MDKMTDCGKIRRMIADRKLATIGIGLGVLFWFLEAAIHTYIFYHDSFIAEIVAPDPHEMWMRSLVVCLFILFGFYAQFIINQRKRAEERVRESESQLKTILDTVQVGIILIDSETRIIVEANIVAVEMIGVPRNQIIGCVCHKYICPSEKGQCPMADHGRNLDNSERVLLTASGKEIPILKTVTSIWLSGGRKHLLESFLDISERKQAEREREKLIGELRDALATVKTLSGLLPICSSCKKIRNEQGHWEQIESYVRDHSEAEFTHSFCPECARKFSPKAFDKK